MRRGRGRRPRTAALSVHAPYRAADRRRAGRIRRRRRPSLSVAVDRVPAPGPRQTGSGAAGRRGQVRCRLGRLPRGARRLRRTAGAAGVRCGPVTPRCGACPRLPDGRGRARPRRAVEGAGRPCTGTPPSEGRAHQSHTVHAQLGSAADGGGRAAGASGTPRRGPGGGAPPAWGAPPRRAAGDLRRACGATRAPDVNSRPARPISANGSRVPLSGHCARRTQFRRFGRDFGREVFPGPAGRA